jgi:rubrerythrin
LGLEKGGNDPFDTRGPAYQWEDKERKTGTMEKTWRCIECGYMYIGDKPPDICPECYAPKESFVEATDV